MLLVRVVYNPNERDSRPNRNLQAHQAHQHFHLIYSLEKNVMIGDNFFSQRTQSLQKKKRLKKVYFLHSN